ncbi:MAG: hypothetical protein ABI852_02330 [Gemmatimonadaceae bacterium]
MRLIWKHAVVASMVWVHALHAQSVNGASVQPPPPLRIPVEIEREVRRLAALNPDGGLWPGFDPLAIPLAVFDGRQTYLFRHPSPPPGFKPLEAAFPNSYVRDGRLEEITANSSAMIGGVMTATIMQTGPMNFDYPAVTAPVAIHEAFHVYQRAHHKDWIANEADLFAYHFEVPQLLTFRRLESDALRRALLSYDPAKSACWVRGALKYRQDRFARMDPSYGAYERGTELNEGLATYVEARSTDRIVEFPANEFPLTGVRQRAYASGSAIATLLDRFRPQWKQEFERGDRTSMEQALGESVGEGKSCQASSIELSLAAQRSWEESSALMTERGKRHGAFMAKPGWRLVVETSGSQPMFPQGFDPLNVVSFPPADVLHTRFLKAGNNLGQIEILNTEALTVSAGVHPIMQGFRSLTVTGLAKPEISDSLGTITVKAPGVSLRFSKSFVQVDSMTVTVKLRGP